MDGTPVPEDHMKLLSQVVSMAAMGDPGELGEDEVLAAQRESQSLQ